MNNFLKRYAVCAATALALIALTGCVDAYFFDLALIRTPGFETAMFASVATLGSIAGFFSFRG